MFDSEEIERWQLASEDVNLHQDVKVTVRPRVAARARAENGQSRDAFALIAGSISRSFAIIVPSGMSATSLMAQP